MLWEIAEMHAPPTHERGLSRLKVSAPHDQAVLPLQNDDPESPCEGPGLARRDLPLVLFDSRGPGCRMTSFSAGFMAGPDAAANRFSSLRSVTGAWSSATAEFRVESRGHLCHGLP